MSAGDEVSNHCTEAAQVLFINLKMQSEMLLLLLRSGALKPEQVRPLAASMALVAKIWERRFPGGLEALEDLRELSTQCEIALER